MIWLGESGASGLLKKEDMRGRALVALDVGVARDLAGLLQTIQDFAPKAPRYIQEVVSLLGHAALNPYQECSCHDSR